MDSAELSGMIFIVPVQMFFFLFLSSQLNRRYSPFEMIQERTFGEIYVF